MAVIAAALLLSGVSAQCTDKESLTFRVVAMGEIEDKAATNAGFHTQSWSGAHFGVTTYKAPHGSALAAYYGDFDNPEEAKRFLDWKAATAFKVLSQSTKRDTNGKPVKYRVELVPASDRPDVEVVWVVGVAVHWISARTLDDALAFEKLPRD
jgi:hypothetical protein